MFLFGGRPYHVCNVSRKIKSTRHVDNLNPRDGYYENRYPLMIAGALVAFGQSGYAQMTPPAAPAAPAVPKAPAAPNLKAPMSAEEMAKKAKSKECSAKADAEKLHGNARMEFRAKCKKG